jgi:hypothetical protein
MKKELVLSARMEFDQADLDKTVAGLQKKLREIYAPGDMVRQQVLTNQRLQSSGIGGNVGGPSSTTSASYGAATMRERRETEQSIQKQVQSQEKMAKLIVQRDDFMRKLEDKQKTMLQGSKEELKVKEQLGKMEENQYKLRETYKQRDALLNQQMDLREKSKQASQGFSAGGFDLMRRHASMGQYGYAANTFGRMFSGMTPDQMKMAGGGMLGAGAGAMAIGRGVENIGGLPMRLEQARGSAVGATTGQDLSKVYGGQAPFEAQWMKERTAASGEAKEKMEFNRKADVLKGVGQLLMGAGGGALMGMKAGPWGAVAGAAAGTGTAYANMGDRTRLSMNPFAGKEYEQMLASQKATDYQQTLEAMKEQNPMKKGGIEYFQNNMMRNVGAQRQMGMGNKQFYGQGGFLNQGANAGFMNEQMIDMSSQIIGAGGSARTGRQAALGLQMQRAGQTNAGNILGSIGGSVQSPEATKRATIGIMAEAFQIGLDNTDFAEENRRFTQAAATIIGRTGATSGEDSDKVSRTLAMFMGQRTGRGVEAATTAYEKYQNRASDVSGRRGQIGMDTAMRDSVLGKLDPDDITELLAARPDQLQEGSAFMAAMVSKANKRGAKTNAKEMLASKDKATASARFLIPANRKAYEKNQPIVDAYKKKQNLTDSEFRELGDQGYVDPAIWAMQGEIDLATSKENKEGYNKYDVEAQAGERAGGLPTVSQKGMATIQKQLEGKGTRVEDRAIAAAAEGQDKAREAFAQMAVEIYHAITGTKALTAAASASADALNKEAAARLKTLPKGNAYNSDVTGTMTNNVPFYLQPQGSRDND